MKNYLKRSLSMLLALIMLLSPFSGLTVKTYAEELAEEVEATAAATESVTEATETATEETVPYPAYSFNTGTRGEVCTELSSAAEAFYTDGYTYESLSELTGAASMDDVPDSALYKALQELMVSNHTHYTTYAETRDQYQYTDCQEVGGKISSFYSGEAIGPEWDGGSTWNREHTWPNSKGLGGDDENDIMMLRPTSKSENSGRSNKAYGESTGYYHPNSASAGEYDVRGDVARIFLYVYVRWGNVNGNGQYTTWGTTGVMESKEVLLSWMEADPVDTWELGRNDVVQEITGTRNVFVDYPELAFLLFDEQIPNTMTTPSGEAGMSAGSYTITVLANDASMGTVALSGNNINAIPAEGYLVEGFEVISGSADVVRNGNAFTVGAYSDCTVQINFAARQQAVVYFVGEGDPQDAVTAYIDDSITLHDYPGIIPEGYEFVGWAFETVDQADQKPVCGKPGDSYTVTGDVTLYALFSYVEMSDDDTVGTWNLVTDEAELAAGKQIVFAAPDYGKICGALNTSKHIFEALDVTFSDDYQTIPAMPASAQIFTLDGQAGAWNFANTSGNLLGATGSKTALYYDKGTTTWTVSITEDGAIVENTNTDYGRLQYNSSAPRFTNYSSDQKTPRIYMLGTGETTYYTTSPNSTKTLSGTCGENVTWTLENGTLTISGNGATEDYTVSSHAPWYDYRTEITAIIVEGGVGGIGSYAFHNCNSAESIVIRDGVIYIGRYAFLGCEDLTEINLPATVTGIDEGAFWGCKGLTGFVIPDGVTQISNNTFEECSNLTNITIPDSVTTIGELAFSCCRALMYIEIPDSVTGFGMGAFGSCNNLMSIRIPDGVTEISRAMFSGCHNLQSVYLPESVTVIGASAFSDCEGLTAINLPENLTAIGDSAFHRCWVLPNMEIPDTVTSIGAGTFVVCWGFTDITIPASVKTIGVEAFNACKNLTTVTFEGDAPEIVTSDEYESQNVFGEQAIVAYYPEDKTGWSEETLQKYGTGVIGVPYKSGGAIVASGTHGENLSWVLDRNGTLTISGTGPMENYDNWTCYRWYYYYGMVENVVVEEGVTTLSDWCFGNMRMKSIQLPDSLTGIGNWMFWECKSLEQISIPGSVTDMGVEVFLNCTGLRKITFEGDAPIVKDSEFYMGWYFEGVTATVYYPSDNATWTEDLLLQYGGTITWKGYTTDGTVDSGTCADTLTWALNRNGLLTISGSGEMPDYSYDNRAPWDEYREEIKSVVIKDGVTNIGARAFSDLSYLTNVTLPDSVTGIGEGAFNDCWYLTEIVIPDSVTSIGDRAFYFCRRLENISIGKGLTTIGYDAFDWCDSLTSITMPAGLASIGDFAFNYCTSLKEIIFEGDAPVFATDGEFEPCHFSEVTATVYYPANNPTWTADVMQNYGGTITWKGYTTDGTVDSGTCGDNLTWKLDDEGTLTISGTGEMKSHPWNTYCEDIKSVVIKDGVTRITDWAFTGCHNVASVSMADSVAAIGDYAFASCSALTEITLGAGVSAIGQHVFYDSKNLKVIRVSDENTVYCSDKNGIVFSKDMKTLVLASEGTNSACEVPDGVVSIGTCAFYNCDALISIKLPNSVTCIEEFAFFDCVNMTDIVIPESVTKIGTSAFSFCTGLKTVTFEGDAPAIKETVFSEVTATAYYPADNATWTEEVMASFGGNITWEAYSEAQPLEAPVAKISGDAETGKPVIKWNTVEGAVKYRVYRSTKKSSGYELIYTAKKGRSYTDKDAKAGTNYYYKVKAIHEDISLNSGWSNVVNRMCDLAQPEVSITGSSASGKPIVKWNTVDGAAKYRVYRAASKDGDYELIYTGIKARSYTDKTAKAGKTYYYKVKAIHSKSSADSAFSETVRRVCDLAKPVVSITRKNGDPRLTWDKIDGAAKYYIYRATSKNGTYTKIKTTVSATSFTDTTAKAGKTYYYKVMAIHTNTNANSAYSSVKYITAK